MEKVEFNSRKLRGKIVEKFGSISAFSKKMNVSEVSVHKFLSGKSDWNRSRLVEASNLLEVSSPEEFSDLFFCSKSLEN